MSTTLNLRVTRRRDHDVIIRKIIAVIDRGCDTILFGVYIYHSGYIQLNVNIYQTYRLEVIRYRVGSLCFKSI